MLALQNIDRQKWVTFFTHLIVIVMIFFLPEMMMNYGNQHRNPAWTQLMYSKSAAYVLIFYLNYYVIMRHTLFGKRHSYIAFVLWNLLLIAAFIFFFYYLSQFIWDFPTHEHRRHKELPHKVLMLHEWSLILRDMGMIVLTIALSSALRFAERWSKMQKHHEQLLANQKSEELQNLKSQLNPHFLFNTLNTIYSLINIDPKEAQNAIHQLSKLLRYVLYENPLQHPLSQEVDFAKTYISLMEMRLGPGVVKSDFSNIADTNIQVAPLIFISLIENALKHGNTGNHEHRIEVSISTDEEGVVTCRTFNHFNQTSADDTEKVKRGGIGLTNLRRRLLLIYGKEASLKTIIEGDTYTAVLTIQTRK